MLALSAAILLIAAGAAEQAPLLFMALDDVEDAWGLIQPVANTVQPAPKHLTPPPENYTSGATIFGSFQVQQPDDEFEVYVVVGRSGEPITANSSSSNGQSKSTWDPPGVFVNRYTTKDFVTWSAPVRVLFLADGWLPGGDAGPLAAAAKEAGLGDGLRWTVKSIARDDTTGTYLMFAAYQTFAFAFTSASPTTANSFAPSIKSASGNFDDHDDTNVFFDKGNNRWVDIQIIFQNHTDVGRPNGAGRKYCDNAGCTKRRVITARTSNDGITWTNPQGCIPHPGVKCWLPGQDPALDQCCAAYNETEIISPNQYDPPELQFYRLRPFLLGKSGRLVGHATLYAPVPESLSTRGDYGYLPLKCRTEQLRPGVTEACHGPHMYEEWFVGPRSQDASEIPNWNRPFAQASALGTQRAAPLSVWLMAPPVVYTPTSPSSLLQASASASSSSSPDPIHLFVADGTMWYLPLYRMAGLYAPANGEFSTPQMMLTKAGMKALWINADVQWGSLLPTGGCDEGCAAYVMVELISMKTTEVIPGFEKEKCLLMNVTGTHLNLVWEDASVSEYVTSAFFADEPVAVQARVYFRDATVYAIGSGDL